MKIKILLIVFVLLAFSTIGIVKAAGENSLASGGCDDTQVPYNHGDYNIGKMDTIIPSIYGEYDVTIYYPAVEAGYSQLVDVSGAPYPMIIFAHGFMASKDYYTWIGDFLASWGYVTAIVSTPSKIDIEELIGGGEVHRQANLGTILTYEYLSDLNVDTTSPLSGLMDTETVGISGHSLGALSGTTLLDTDAIPLKAAVLLAPPHIQIEDEWELLGITIEEGPSYDEVDWDSITAAVQYHIGSNDGMLPPAGVWRLYDLLPSGKKEILEVNGANHSGYMDPGLETFFANLLDDDATITMEEHHKIISDYMLAWFEYYLRGDTSYEDQLFGSIIANDKASGVLVDYAFEQ